MLVRELVIASARANRLSRDFQHIADALLELFPVGTLERNEEGVADPGGPPIDLRTGRPQVVATDTSEDPKSLAPLPPKPS